MNEVVVQSWSELQDRLFADSWRAPLGRFRSSYAFRGRMDAAPPLRTSLARLGEQAERHELHIIRNFRKYAYRTTFQDSVWNWLAVGQHHGLPTRLLDWTFSPYVALHFVTADHDQFDRDGCVWCVDYVKTHKMLPPALQAELRSEGSDVFTTETLSRVAPSLAEFDGMAADPEKPFACFFEPPSLDDRIVNQFAMFSVLSNPLYDMQDWLEGHSGVAHRLIIPKSLKWEVRDKLDQANITERVLFPGLDGLSRWLRRYYTPRSPDAPQADEDDEKISTPLDQDKK